MPSILDRRDKGDEKLTIVFSLDRRLSAQLDRLLSILSAAPVDTSALAAALPGAEAATASLDKTVKDNQP